MQVDQLLEVSTRLKHARLTYQVVYVVIAVRDKHKLVFGQIQVLEEFADLDVLRVFGIELFVLS